MSTTFEQAAGEPPNASFSLIFAMFSRTLLLGLLLLSGLSGGA
jgi:hypothetical protein